MHFSWLFLLARSLGVILISWAGEGAFTGACHIIAAINSFGFVRVQAVVALESMFMEIIHLSGQEHILSLN